MHHRTLLMQKRGGIWKYMLSSAKTTLSMSKELWITFFCKKSTFDHEIVVSDNANMIFECLELFYLCEKKTCATYFTGEKSFWWGGGCRILSLLLTYGDKGRGQKSENLADIICASFLMVIGCYGSHEYNVVLINSFKALKPFHLNKS